MQSAQRTYKFLIKIAGRPPFQFIHSKLNSSIIYNTNIVMYWPHIYENIWSTCCGTPITSINMGIVGGVPNLSCMFCYIAYIAVPAGINDIHVL